MSAMTISEWRRQLQRDKKLYEQAKEHKKKQKRGYGDPLVASLVGEYGKLYRESLAGYKRALKRRKKLKKVV